MSSRAPSLNQNRISGDLFVDVPAGGDTPSRALSPDMGINHLATFENGPRAVIDPSAIALAAIGNVRTHAENVRDKTVEADGKSGELSGVESFWGERHAAAQTASFSEQVAEVMMQPEKRSNIIESKPEAILSDKKRRSKQQFTEREGLLDLDDFLLTVIKTTEGKADERSIAMREQASEMRNFNFLGKEESDRACEGMAMMWKEYLAASPDNVLNVYNPTLTTQAKSYNVVLKQIVDKFAELTKDNPDAAARLRLDPAQWRDGKGARLLIVDDLISSGSTLRRNAEHAALMADQHGLSGLRSKLEAQVLMARPSVINQDWRWSDAPDSKFVVRSYFETKSDKPLASPSAYNSSVDFSFEQPLQEMGQYLSDQGLERESPLLTDIKRPYREEKRINPEDEQLANQALKEIAALRRTIDILDRENRESRERAENDPGSTRSRVAKSIAKIHFLERINTLKSKYMKHLTAGQRRQATADRIARERSRGHLSVG